LFGRLFVGAHAGELASLCSQRDGRSNENESERGAQASRRYAVNAGADDCRCFVHGVILPDDPASPLAKGTPRLGSALRLAPRSFTASSPPRLRARKPSLHRRWRRKRPFPTPCGGWSKNITRLPRSRNWKAAHARSGAVCSTTSAKNLGLRGNPEHWHAAVHEQKEGRLSHMVNRGSRDYLEGHGPGTKA
jgi:hypothetical protein